MSKACPLESSLDALTSSYSNHCDCSWRRLIERIQGIMRNWSQMMDRLVRGCWCCLFPAYGLPSLYELFSHKLKAFFSALSIKVHWAWDPVAFYYYHLLWSSFYDPSSSCTDTKYQCSLSDYILPFPDLHDCWASVRCPWYYPHLNSLCTILAALENFLFSWRHVLLSGHPTPSFFICRYFLPCFPVVFSPHSPIFSKPSASSH